MTTGDLIKLLSGYDPDTQIEVIVGSYPMPFDYEITMKTDTVIIHAFAGTAETKRNQSLRSDFPSTMIGE